jgi:MoxR-like ATPase
MKHAGLHVGLNKDERDDYLKCVRSLYQASKQEEEKMSLQKIREVQSHLNKVVLEREMEVSALLSCVLVGQHLFLLGKPGVAKSMLIEELTQCISGATMFKRLMSPTTERSELMGPISLKHLKEHDVIRHNTSNMLPSAHFAMLDEIFKANSTTLNDLLTILNERMFDNGPDRIRVPLMSCLAASNEIPKEESLRALYDRFLARVEVQPLMSQDSFATLMNSSFMPSTRPQLSLEELREAQARVTQVEVPAAFVEALWNVREMLMIKVPHVYVSDRRFKYAVQYVRAQVLLSSGERPLIVNDLLYLNDCLWSDPKDRLAIQQCIIPFCSVSINVVQQLVIEAEAMIDMLENQKRNGQDVRQTYAGITKIADKIAEMRKEVPDNAEHIDRIALRVKNAMKDARAYFTKSMTR